MQYIFILLHDTHFVNPANHSTLILKDLHHDKLNKMPQQKINISDFASFLGIKTTNQ